MASELTVPDDSVRIVSLTSTNVQRLRVVQVRPDPAGGLVIVGGNNEQGKTSLLLSIICALGGERMVPPDPIRTGEDKASVVVELGGEDGKPRFRITRTITPKASYLRLELVQPDGMVLEARSPQKVIEAMKGDLTFDPLAFNRMKPPAQRALLLGLLGLDETLDDMDVQRKALMETRRDTKRDLAQVTAAIKEMPPLPIDTPAEAITADDITGALREIEAQRQTWDDAEGALDKAQDALYKAEDNLKEATVTHAAAEAQCRKDEAALDALGFRPDTAELEAQIANVSTVNADVDRKRRMVELVASEQALLAVIAGHQAALDDLGEEQDTLLHDAEMPVPGLGVSPDGVMYEDLPLQQAAQSVQLHVSAAIGMAKNPRLRVMLIQDGSLLDNAHLAALAKLAGDKEYQIWVERVGTGDAGAVIIEDGSVVGSPDNEVANDE